MENNDPVVWPAVWNPPNPVVVAAPPNVGAAAVLDPKEKLVAAGADEAGVDPKDRDPAAGAVEVLECKRRSWSVVIA